MATTYVAFLRSINVGGRSVKMDRLRELFSELGFKNVRTFIQSGNVAFEARAGDRARLTQKIEKHLEAELGYAVPAMLRTIAELERVFERDPFQQVKVTPDVRLCVMFLARPLPKDVRFPLVSPKKDAEVLSAAEGEAFVVARVTERGFGNPAQLIEKGLGIPTTLRFYATLGRILEAAKNGAGTSSVK